jgi:bacterioferritin-associated ferredoxin
MAIRSESMVVCVCNAIREKDLRAAVRTGSDRPNDVYARLGRKPKCGQCLSFARNIISAGPATA